MSSRRCWAVVPAAGSGSRMGSDTPKQYVAIAGKTLLEHSVLALLEVTFQYVQVEELAYCPIF